MSINTIKNLIVRAGHGNRRDYIDMGLGIEARAKRCYNYWKPHLELTKAFQKRALNLSSSQGSLAVLGAGSLLDIDIEELQKHFTIIELIDANPLARNHWKKSIKNFGESRIRGTILDLTNSIDDWTEELIRFLKLKPLPKEEALCDFLLSLRPGPRLPILDKFDVIFSINLLSQIPIYWRDRVHQLVLRKLKIDTNDLGLYSAKLQDALQSSMALLQQNHLKTLSLSKANLIVLISDLEFFYYKKDCSEWQSEEAIHFTGKIQIDGYKENLSESWLWHIIPQGIEEEDFGSYHKVVATAFLK